MTSKFGKCYCVFIDSQSSDRQIKEKMKNNLYIIASEISGNSLENGYVQSNFSNEIYYALQSESSKKDFIKNYGENLADFSEHDNQYLSEKEIALIYDYLEKQFDNSSDHFAALQNLIN